MNSLLSPPVSRRNFLKASAGLAATALTPAASLSLAKVMESDDELAWKSGLELRQLMLSKKLSPVELTQHMLKRISELDPLIHSYVTIDETGAMAQAKKLEQALMQKKQTGLLFGLPISIKDLVMTKNLRTTYGSAIYKNNIPKWDEIQVERARQAGAIILGKVNTSEFGMFSRTKNLVAGETLNPWNTAHISGASSGGSGAAVAMGISGLSIASDGGGSTRLPSCFNGVFGFQPSAGRIPMRIPRKTPMSSTGPCTRYVEDAALMMSVLGGPDPRDPSAIEHSNPNYLEVLNRGVKGMKMAWTPDFGRIPTIDQRVTDSIQQAAFRFKDAGAAVETIETFMPETSWEVFYTLNGAERGTMLANLSPEQFDLLSPALKTLFQRLQKSPQIFTKDMEINALEHRAELYHWSETLFSKYDVICCPTTNMTAPKIPDGWQQPYEHPLFEHQISTPFTHIANVLGLPAASVPCGFVDGLPIGLQIIGRRLEDAKVLRVAQSFAEIQPWMDNKPKLAKKV